MIWWRLSVGSCLEGNNAISLYIGSQAWVFDWFGQNFDGTAESLSDAAFERNQSNEIHLGRWVEFGREVHVAVFLGFTSRNGSEKRQVTDASTAQLRLVRPQGGDHVLGEIGRGPSTHRGISEILI